MIIDYLDYTYMKDSGTLELHLNTLIDNPSDVLFNIDSHETVKKIINHFTSLFEELTMWDVVNESVAKTDSDLLTFTCSSHSYYPVKQEYYFSVSFKLNRVHPELSWNLYMRGNEDVFYPFFEHLILEYQLKFKEEVLGNLIQFRKSINAASAVEFDPVWKKSYLAENKLVCMVPYMKEYDTEMIRHFFLEKEINFKEHRKKERLNPFHLKIINIILFLISFLAVLVFVILSITEK